MEEPQRALPLNLRPPLGWSLAGEPGSGQPLALSPTRQEKEGVHPLPQGHS